MYAKKDGPIDHTFRLACRSCGYELFSELGGEDFERARNGDDVELECGVCRSLEPFEVVAP